MSAIVNYPTTLPRFTDTQPITEAKWLQCLVNGAVNGGLTQTISFPTTEVLFSDTELSVEQKILQVCNGG